MCGYLCNFGRMHYAEHFCEIIFKWDQWLRCHLNIFLFLDMAVILLDGAEKIVQILQQA